MVGKFRQTSGMPPVTWPIVLPGARCSVSQRARPGMPAGAVPARVASVAGLPPAWIGVGSIDLFVEEDMEYARRLVHAGVATELLVVRGANRVRPPPKSPNNSARV